MGVSVDVQTLKDDMKSHGIALKGAGQLSFKTSFKSPDKVKVDITDETAMKYITYMSKGKYDPKYFTKYTPEEIKACRDAWVDYKHKSKDEVFYVDFLKHIYETEKILGVKMELSDIRRYAVNFALRKYSVLNLGCRRDAAMLYSTYCYSNFKDFKVVLPFE
jgi:hypothetical protein